MAKRLFRLDWKTAAAVVLFLLLFVFFASRDARAESEMSIEAGSAIVRGETPVLGFAVRWLEAGPGKMDFEAGLHLAGESTSRGIEEPNVASVYGMVVPSWRKFEAGLGVAYHNNETQYSCEGTFALMLGYRWERVNLRLQHFSSAGSCEPNPGRDFIKIGWVF